jgi:hypothetical protein
MFRFGKMLLHVPMPATVLRWNGVPGGTTQLEVYRSNAQSPLLTRRVRCPSGATRQWSVREASLIPDSGGWNGIY